MSSSEPHMPLLEDSNNAPYTDQRTNQGDLELSTTAAPDMTARTMAVPTIHFDLREHKRAIAVTWTILFLSSALIPVVLYFALRYGAQLELHIGELLSYNFKFGLLSRSAVLAVTTAIFGVVSLFSLFKRTWSLVKPNSTCRPLGGTRWQASEVGHHVAA